MYLFKRLVMVFVFPVAVASASVLVQEFQQQSMSSTVMTNDYTLSVEAGDAVVLAVTGNKTASSTPIAFSSSAGALEQVDNSLEDPYPCSYMAYQIVQIAGTYDFRIISAGAITARSGLYVLRADAGTLVHVASAKFASAALTTSDQTLVYSWSGDVVSGGMALECVSSRYASVAPLTSTEDYANGVPAKRYLGHVANVEGSSFSSTYSLSLETTIGGVGLLFGELSASPQPPVFGSNPVEGGAAVQDQVYAGTLVDSAFDPNGDAMFFSKTNGPAWLSVATNGDLSGTPLIGDVGTNSWTVLVTDGISGTNSATLQVNVLSGLPEPQTSQTNIVLIVIDDLGWMDLSVQGSEFYETPRIDELAQNGMRFTQGYASHPRCLPSRYGLMTGRFPGASAVPADPPDLLDEEVTIGEALQPAGYATFFAGKWHISHDDVLLPQRQGFDINISGGAAGSPPTYFFPYRKPGEPEPVNELTTSLFLDNTTPVGGMVTDRITGKSYRRTHFAGEAGEYITDRLTDEALDWMEWNADQPMFLYMSHYGVHTPYEAPADLVAKYEAKLITMDYGDTPEFISVGVGQQKMRQNHPTYAAMIESVDTNIGRLMDKVEELGLSGNTIFIFTSDNGGLSNRGGYSGRELATSNEPLRTGKGWLYEGGIREAFIVKGPGIPSMVNSNAVLNGTDIYPTILELTGQPLRTNDHVNGVSFKSALTGAAYDRGEPILWHSPLARPYSTGDFNSTALRDGDYKLIWWYDTPGQNGEFHYELYNVKTDPGETTDLSESMPAKAADLLAQIKAWHNHEHWERSVGVIQRPDADDVSKPLKSYLDDPTIPTTLVPTLGSIDLSWGNWVGYDYNIFSKTNLQDTAWEVEESGSTTNTATLPRIGSAGFYKVELLLQQETP